MDTMTMEILKKIILSGHADWCVSLFMPTHRAGRKMEQDPIRFKNLLREVEDRLVAKGLRSPEARAMLEAPRRLLLDTAFWQRQSDGLAMFFTKSQLDFFRLPYPFDELVVISRRFHVKPLLPFLTGDGRFYILALSQNGVRLLEGTRDAVDEINFETAPQSLSEAFLVEPSEKQLQFHTGTPSGAGMRRRAMFFGHDATKEEKNRITRWFGMIDKELSKLLEGGKSPLVLAGVEYLLSLYREANTCPHLVDKGIPGNPEELRPEELHSHAWTIVQPVFIQSRQKAAADYLKLAGTGQTATRVEEVVPAAIQGRVEILFVALGVQVWGRFDPNTYTVHVHDAPEPGDEDLLDLAAIHSWLNRGVVYAVAPEDMPGGNHLAAIFRY